MGWILSLCLAAIVAPQALGQYTGIQMANSENAVIGKAFNFTLVGAPPLYYISSVTWYMRYHWEQPEVGGGGVVLPWKHIFGPMPGGGAPLAVAYPGRWQVGAHISYVPYMPGGLYLPYQDEEEAVFYFPPPDKLSRLTDPSIPVPLEAYIWMQYEIRTGVNAIGMDVQGDAQEKVTDIWQRVPPFAIEEPEDQDWFGPAPTFGRLGNVLQDCWSIPLAVRDGVRALPSGVKFGHSTREVRDAAILLGVQ